MTFTSDLASTHRTHLLTSLNHRLDVAKANHNERLVAVLEHEYRQITALSEPRTIASRWQQLWMSFADTLSEWTKVQIEQTVDANGRLRWYAYNPQAGEALVTDSKEKMQQWIKSSYWGR
ncbi:MAG: hypothetical protein HC800_15210 [Phormidesmis sp. RL_2_1]|nr:hypothetical protein [Phormidesmis sp. RL_2_1]